MTSALHIVYTTLYSVYNNELSGTRAPRKVSSTYYHQIRTDILLDAVLREGGRD